MEGKKSIIYNCRLKYNLYKPFKIERLIKLIISFLISKFKLKKCSYKVKNIELDEQIYKTWIGTTH